VTGGRLSTGRVMSVQSSAVVGPIGRGGWCLAEVALPGGAGRYLLKLMVLVAAYYVAAHVGYAFQFSGPVAAIVWLPVGVGIAFLYVGGIRFWPGVVIGDLLVNNYSTLPVGSALGQSVGNLLEVLVAVVLMRRLCPRAEPLASLPGVGGMAAAILCGTLVSATIGSLCSWLGGVIGGHSLPYVWRTWWLGDLSGALIVVPLALAWSSLPARPWRRARVVENVVLLAVVTGLSMVQLRGSMMLCALVFPALIWTALRFGARATTLAVTIICAFAVWGATNHRGPFGVGSIDSRLLESQLFIATVLFCALAIVALVAERAQLADGVRASRARLVAASDVARQRLERDLHDGAQQGLLGLRLKLELAAEVIPRDSREGQRQLAVIGRQMDEILADLRSLAHGTYPHLLGDRGMVQALKSAGRLHPADVSVHAVGVGRYSKAIEAAVYFCCLEALQNVAKHAGHPARAEVRLWEQAKQLRFAVTDSGTGFDSDATQGNGLANMRDRIEAVGGALTVSSRPGHGTAIHGRVPIIM
jgi:signal transduction histidine kinase